MYHTTILTEQQIWKPILSGFEILHNNWTEIEMPHYDVTC